MVQLNSYPINDQCISNSMTTHTQSKVIGINGIPGAGRANHSIVCGFVKVLLVLLIIVDALTVLIA